MMTMVDKTSFAAALAQTPIDVPCAALRFAREIAYPELDVAHYLRRLEVMAGDAAARLGTAPAAADLAHYLFVDEGFAGNAAAYDDPRNSYLNEVLERRLGIPISLSVIFVAVARHLGLEAYGVGLPGHYIVGVHEGVDELLLDPFHGGERLTLADCERLVQETTGFQGRLDPVWLQPTTPHDALARMLNNLRLIYLQREAWDDARAVIGLLRQVQPDASSHLRDLGLIHYQQGDLLAAARLLEAFLEREPESAEASAILQNLRDDFARWSRLN